jgi:hypothetical protein
LISVLEFLQEGDDLFPFYWIVDANTLGGTGPEKPEAMMVVTRIINFMPVGYDPAAWK